MKRVLVVEDDPDILDGIATTLREQYEVATAHDGRDALEVLSRETFDAIVLDLMMPGTSGEQVVAELAERSVRTPVVLVSAAGGLASRARALRVFDWLAKPFDIVQLEEKVARAIAAGSRTGGGAGSSPPPGPSGPRGPGGGSRASRSDEDDELRAAVGACA